MDAFLIVHTFDANALRIDFEETGFSNGFGTLLDDIRIYDSGPSVL